MELQDGEEKIAQHSNVMLTNRRVIKESKSLLGNKNIEEVWLDHIDSVGYEKRFAILVLIIAFVFIFSVISFWDKIKALGQPTLMIVFLVVLLLVNLFFLLTKEKLVIRTASNKIDTHGDGSEEFRKTLDDTLSKMSKELKQADEEVI